MGVSDDADVVRLRAIYKTIPNKVGTETVTTGGDQLDLSDWDGLDCRGRWVYVSCYGSDVTLLRGSTATTAGAGLVIIAGAPPIDLWIDESGDVDIYCIAHTANSSVSISLDDEP